MRASQAWKKLFNVKHLKEHYIEKIKVKPSIGMDKITPKKFEEEIEQNIEIILRKVSNSTYHFTRYKQLLFTKGPCKNPRAICVPTLRDKLTVSVLNELLGNVYGNSCRTEMPQIIIDSITKQISNYDYFIKLDIKAFYSSINQEILMSKLKKRIRKSEILYLIECAIKTEAISYPVKEKCIAGQREKGVPEGLPISNALANIYLSEIDEKYSKQNNIKYWRYVDDILILVNKDYFDIILNNISKDIKKLSLELNEKKGAGEVSKGFEYLGYKISPNLISVRRGSILKIEQSIEDLFRTIKSKNIQYIVWKLNLKITGFILEEHKYGWLFFYSQITDINLLFHLDNIINKFINRYKLEGKIKIKKFVRAYHEMRLALHETNYIPNLDMLSLEKKRELLSDIYELDLSGMNEEKIEISFRRIMSKEIRDIERDIQNIS